MTFTHLNLCVLPDELAICRLAPTAAVPDWYRDSDFSSMTRTAEELSIVCRSSDVPSHCQAERGWRLVKIVGPLDFSLTGTLASLATPLAEADIPIFTLSTFDTDYVLVPSAKLPEALAALEEAGHSVVR